MATVNDIPVRGGVSGQDQLALLRAYLKDSDSNNYKYPDTLLIPLLVKKDAVTVWQDITGAPKDAVPWSFDPLKISSPVNRIRIMINDTVEFSLRYTDYELLKYLNVIPLRYVISLIKAKEADKTTYPSDVNDPIRIVRDLLDDKDGKKYTDKQIADLLLESGLDPYSFVVEVMKKSGAESAATSSIATGGSTHLATLDGISFTSKSASEEVSERQNSQEIILGLGANSIYGKGSQYYGFWMNGVNLVDVDWEAEWYAL